jgi:hypothetical protein
MSKWDVLGYRFVCGIHEGVFGVVLLRGIVTDFGSLGSTTSSVNGIDPNRSTVSFRKVNDQTTIATKQLAKITKATSSNQA